MASRVVLIQCGDHLENQHRLLALAQALQAQGWVPVVLCYRSQGVFFLRQAIDVIALDIDHAGSRRRWLSEAVSASVNDAAFGLRPKKILELEAARRPSHFNTWAKRSKAMLRLVRRAQRLHEVLERTQPAHVYVWNGHTGVVAQCLRQFCEGQGIDHSFLERGLVRNSVFVDAQGVNGSSKLHKMSLEALAVQLGSPALALSALALPACYARPPACAASARARLRDRYNLTGKRLIFVPLQVQRDTNILFHSDHVKTMAELTTAISNALPANAVAVVRSHPEESETGLGLPRRDNLRYVADGDLQLWCESSDLVVTINSTVGLSALVWGCPVVALGRAIYTGKNLCVESDLASLEQVLADASTYEARPYEDVETFVRALSLLHTAGPEHVRNDLLGSLPAGGHSSPVFNALSRVPARLQEHWNKRYEPLLARLSQCDAPIHVVNELPADASLNLSYRQAKVSITPAHLRKGLAALFGVEAARLVISPNAPEGTDPDLLLRQQSQQVENCSWAGLVLDEYLEPHLCWLLGSET